MSKFKVGDQVRSVFATLKDPNIIGVVTSTRSPVAGCVSVDFEGKIEEFHPENLELVYPAGVTGSEGIKHDQSKVDLSLNPLAALNEMAKAFMHGEKKYGRNNYKKGMESHRYIAAALRHITAWQNGESLDPESNNHHLGHALASLAMLLECERIGSLKDTRNANT